MLVGYNTNGLADHSLEAAIELVAELGYKCIAITLDHSALNPFGSQLDAEIERVERLLQDAQLAVVIETGARYLLDPRRKHQPTLLSPTAEERQRRVDFLCQAIEIACRLSARCVSLWSGTLVEPVESATAVERLAETLQPVIDLAARSQMLLGFEPEPGMLIDTMDRFRELLELVSQQGEASRYFQLTIDLGHLHCQGETPIPEKIAEWSDHLVNLHIEDMCRGRHEHLFFGEGEMDFPPILSMLADLGYAGPLVVELSRDSHRGAEMARRSIEFLRPLIPSPAS